MKDLIIQAIKASIERYPDIIPLLTGDAALIAQILAYKAGEAPDDDERLANELLLTGKVTGFLKRQLTRIIKALRDHYGLLPAHFWNDEMFQMFVDVGPHYTGIILNAVDGGISLLDATGLGQMVNMDHINTNLIRWTREYRDVWLSKITETSREFIAEKITDWLQSGDPLESLVQSLMDDPTHMFSEMRARRIAVTEVTRLYAMGNQMAWEESGTIDKFRWNTANDELVCKICGERNQQEYPLGELANMMPAHVNCRCWATPIVSLELIQRQRERDWEGVTFD